MYAEYLLKLFGEQGKLYLMMQSNLNPQGYEFLTLCDPSDDDDCLLWSLMTYYSQYRLILYCWWAVVRKSRDSRAKSIKIRQHSRSSSTHLRSRLVKRSHLEACASDALNKSHGNYSTTSTNAWLNQPDAHCVNKKTFWGRIWAAANLAHNH